MLRISILSAYIMVMLATNSQSQQVVEHVSGPGFDGVVLAVPQIPPSDHKCPHFVLFVDIRGVL